MALIRQLKSFLAKTNIYPKTLTSAVYDNEGNRLDNKLGAASLSGYADGTITGAVKSACDDVETLKSDVNQINSNLENKLPTIVYKGETDLNDVIFPFGISSMFVPYACTVNTPESVLGGNAFFILNMFSGEQFQAQIAFGFSTDKVAIRRKYNSSTWTDWKAIYA